MVIGRLDGGGVELGAVVERDAMAQLERVGRRVRRNGVGRGQPGKNSLPVAVGSHHTSGSNIAKVMSSVNARPVAPGSSVSGGAAMPIVNVPPLVAKSALVDKSVYLLVQCEDASRGATAKPVATAADIPRKFRREIP